ncbi:hypothetical protein ACN47E_009537 [Coniothyrium glycines]
MSRIANHDLTPAGTRVNTIVLVFTLVTGLVVFLRLFTRLVLSKAAGFEDACILFAMMLAIALAVTVSEQAMHGLGRHDNRLTDDEKDKLLKAFWAGVWIYNLALMVTKISILVQYLRIFPVRRFRQACYAVLSVVLAAGGWAVFSSIFICSPVAFSWIKDIPGGQCMNQLVIWFTNAGLNIALDVFILLMPIPVINTLQISRGQKTGLITMFALGASVTLVSVIRLSSLDSISNSTDISWDNPAHASLSAVEVNVGIICACLPAMRPLLAIMMPEYFSDTQQYTNAARSDVERRPHTRKPSNSTNANSTHPNTPRNMTPRPSTPLQPLRPVICRTASGKFSVASKFSLENSSRVNLAPSASHSRSNSNASIASTALKPKPLRFQGPLNPLNMSPVTPFSPPRADGVSPLAPGAYTRRPSNFSSTTLSTMPPQTPATATKPLPITPFPVGLM